MAESITFSDGEVYTGLLNANKQMHSPSENATLKFTEAIEYVGFFDCNMMTRGTITYKEQDAKFEGTFQNNQWHQGVYTVGLQQPRVLYKGSFENQEVSGQMEIQWQNGSRYQGGCLNGQLHGEGVLTLPAQNDTDVCEIVGEWSNGNLDRCTKLIRKDGSYAEGALYDPKNGSVTGEGTIRIGNCTLEGFFTHANKGLLSDEAKITYDNEDGTRQGTYTGALREGKRDGLGVYTWENGSRYEGPFNGQMDSTLLNEQAKMVWVSENGTKQTFVGKFKDGQCTEGKLNDIPIGQ